MHGGIALHSELGQGTKTTFWLPFQKARMKALDLGTADYSGAPIVTRLDLSTPGRLHPKQNINQRSYRPPTDTSNHPVGIRQSQTIEAVAVHTLLNKSKETASSTNHIDRKETRVLVVEDK